ncbi:molybdopterin oxidoreductase family protein, partial [Clostridium sp.]|uniref:molybdopterin oxidoreductase family protein n=1 Tax=Clostridium sp. TaxID=1506 RepID=UPI003F3F162E
SWDEAYKIFVDKMTGIQEKYGKESVAFLSTGQILTEECALLGLVGRSYMGINGDGNTRQCMATSVVAHKQSFGFDSPPYTLEDLELSDTIIIIGGNPVIAHPVAWSRIRDNKEAKLIVVDPRKSETAINADVWIDIKPKTDLTLLYTLANLLIEKDWIDKEYIDKYSEGFEGFKEHVKKFTLDNVEKETGISKERVLDLAQTIRNGKRVSIWWTMGVNQGYQAVRTAQAIINLAVMTGNIGRPGTGPNSFTGQCNAMGSRVYSNTTGLYGGGDYDNEKRRKRVAEVLDIDPDMLPTKPTLPYSEIVNKVNSGEIKGLWVICTNPRHSWANNRTFKKAMEKLEFFVVQDIYYDTDTAVYADLFMPSVPATKKDGFIINTERRMSAVLPVLEKEENEKTDYEIFFDIGKALGMGDYLDKWKTPKDAFELLKECSRGMPCDITGVTYDMLKNSNGVQWPLKEGEKLTSDNRRLFEDNKFFTPSGKVKFMYEDVAENPTLPTKDYPYILNSGRGTVGQWHTQTRTREIPLVEKVSLSNSYVHIHPELAEELGLKENERIRLNSLNGESSEFDVRISSTVKKDHLYAPIHYIEMNALTPSIFDTYSKEPYYKCIAVNIEKIS